jgi:hypothetical protein
VKNHRPYCKCERGFRGDPFTACEREPLEDQTPQKPINPCYPSPCGSFSTCREVNGQAICACLNDMIGKPPNCHPECTDNSMCRSDQACINQKCKDPCLNSICAPTAQCRVNNHVTICVCPDGLIGDPLINCEKQQDYPIQVYTPCSPNPCSINAICREQNGAGACICEENYIGDPYSPNGCRPECILDSDCPSHLACLQNKCRDPCPGSCAPFAICQVISHSPSCTCDVGYTGDGFRYCNVQRDERKISFKIIHTNFITKFTNYLKKDTKYFIQIFHNSFKIIFPLSIHSNLSKSMFTITMRSL